MPRSTTDLLLRDLLITLKTKIQNAAQDAKPEELAYLASAIDKIGGRATVLEVENIGDVKMDEIDALVLALRTDVLAAFEAKRVSVNASVTTNADNKYTAINDAITALVNAANTNITNSKNAAETSVNNTRAAAITAVNASAAAVTAAAAAAVLTPAKLFFLCQN